MKLLLVLSCNSLLNFVSLYLLDDDWNIKRIIYLWFCAIHSLLKFTQLLRFLFGFSNYFRTRDGTWPFAKSIVVICEWSNVCTREYLCTCVHMRVCVCFGILHAIINVNDYAQLYICLYILTLYVCIYQVASWNSY